MYGLFVPRPSRRRLQLFVANPYAASPNASPTTPCSEKCLPAEGRIEAKRELERKIDEIETAIFQYDFDKENDPDYDHWTYGNE